MSRKKKLLLNTLIGIIKQLVTIICGFILPRYMLLYYGSSINGLVISIENFLGFISLLDMGVGAVIQANLYKPLAEKDDIQISKIVLSSERFFRRLAYIFGVYIIILCVLFPITINTTYDTWFSISLLLIISVSILVQYLFGITYQLLLNADQKAYVPLTLQIGTLVLNTVSTAILITMGMPIHIVKLATTGIYIFRPFIQMAYVRKNYRINRQIEIWGEPIKQKWNGFSQHLAAVICQNIDIAVLTLFSTLKNVSIYSVYYTITIGVEQIVMTAATGIESLFGNMIANGEKSKLVKTFSVVEWVTHTGVTFIFTVAAITIVPFVSVYTEGIDDANYIVPLFGVLLVSAYGIQCLRVPYFRIIKAAGHFRETQNGAYLSAAINVVVTVSFVFKYGLIGAAAGTFAAMLYHTCYFVWYLRKNILERSPKYFIRYIITDCVVAEVSYLIMRNWVFTGNSYVLWIVFAIKVSLIVFLVSAFMSSLFYRSQIKRIVKLFRT